MKKITGMIAAVLVLMVVSAGAADFDKGKRAYHTKDYETALKELTPLAEGGHAEAQNFLGLMHYIGQGVSENYEEAVKWYRNAAEQGHAIAQHNLADMYARGEGISQDNVSAYVWYKISGENGNQYASEYENSMAKFLSLSQFTKAQALAKKCLESNYKDCP